MQLFENTPLDRTRHAFSMQFEEEGDGFLYRQGQSGPAYPLSTEERDGFVRRYTIQIYASAFLLVAGLLATVFAVGTYTEQMDAPPPDETIVTGLIITAVIWVIGYFILAQRIWTAPGRALSRRAAVRMDRGSEATAQAKYSKISWSQLALGGAAVGFLTFKFSQKYDLTQGPGLIFTGLIAVGAIVLVYQIVQKLRAG